MKFKSLKSPLIIQLSPETKQAASNVAKGCQNSLATLRLKTGASIQAFKATKLPEPGAPVFSSPTCFVD